MSKIDGDTLKKISSVAAFLLPAGALWLKSGYTYGVAIFLFASLCFFCRWSRCRQSRLTIGIAFLFFAMACLWYELSAFSDGLGRWDRSAKFALSILCLFYAVNFPPKREAFYWGLIVGCAGAGLTGLWQVYYLGSERASGYTNAIQWGNIALLMATMLATQVAIFWQQMSWRHRFIAIACILLGIEASILSASRGGWLALALVVPALGFFILRYRRHLLRHSLLALLSVVIVFSVTNWSTLSSRWIQIDSEVSQYVEKEHANTSLGIRLEQYRLSIEMIKERPLLGWGMRGYLDEMNKRVDDGRYAESIREFNFIHNEFLDLWTKTGVLGVSVQASLYIYILMIFWPTRHRMKSLEGDPELWKNELALRLNGIVLPIMYFAFGQSQHFFVHNSGIIFFVFSVIILWSALTGLAASVHRTKADVAK